MYEKILEAIKNYICQHSYPPTVREIGIMVGIKSSSTVHKYLEGMYARGLIETDHPGCPRAIRVAEKGREDEVYLKGPKK